MASFSVQTIEFIFKRSNFNSNRSITSRRITTACQPQRQAIVRAVPPGPALVWAILPGSGRRQPRCPVPLPRPRRRAEVHNGWALPPAIGTSLTSKGMYNTKHMKQFSKYKRRLKNTLYNETSLK
jgi:hypothetical protein